MRGKIGGFITCPFIALDNKGNIDENGLREHTNFLIEKGVRALYCIGAVGEFPSMTSDQRRKVAETIVDEASKRIPVVIHVGSNSLAETINLAKHSEEIGADAVYCVPPFFYSQELDDAAALAWFKNVAGSIKIPVHFYNIPSCTKFNASVDFLSELAKIPNLTAEKDSTGDLAMMQMVQRQVNIDIFEGIEFLYLPALTMGASGIVSGLVGPVFPELVVEFYDVFKAKDFEKANALQSRITDVGLAIATSAAPNRMLSAIKGAIGLRGIRMSPKVLSPLTTVTEQELRVLESRLKKLKAI